MTECSCDGQGSDNVQSLLVYELDLACIRPRANDVDHNIRSIGMSSRRFSGAQNRNALDYLEGIHVKHGHFVRLTGPCTDRPSVPAWGESPSGAGQSRWILRQSFCWFCRRRTRPWLHLRRRSLMRARKTLMALITLEYSVCSRIVDEFAGASGDARAWTISFCPVAQAQAHITL